MNPPQSKTYRSEFDPGAYHRSSIAYMRRFRWTYIKSYAHWGLWLIPYGFGLFVFPAQATLRSGWMAGTLVYVVCAFIGGAIYGYSDVHRRLDEARGSPGESLDCSVSDEGWTFTYPSGYTGFYPWETMRVTFESQDAFVVQADDTEFTVLRKPLQDAGLEEEFVSRIEAARASCNS